jgi:predicted regulator of Ras-like GTPase activity (Roadblock/LC7/MglB family)
MTGVGTPEVERKLKATGILDMVVKPIDLDSLAKTIIQGLETSVEEGFLSGISLDSFLQLMEMEQKTCLLEVQGKDEEKQKGYLFFKSGDLYDAIQGDTKGERAALTILGLEDVRIRFMKIPKKPLKKFIEKPLMKLLLEASRFKDEAEAEEDQASSPGNAPEKADAKAGMALQAEGSSLRKADDQAATQDAPDTPIKTLKGGDKKETIRAFSNGKGDEDLEASETHLSEGGNQMALKDVLETMASEIDHLIATGVQGMDGVELARYSPINAPTEQFAARFALVMKLEQNVCKELAQLGALEENIMQTEKAFVYTSMLGSHHYLGIAISKEGTLGMVRMVAQKYAEKFKAELS